MAYLNHNALATNAPTRYGTARDSAIDRGEYVPQRQHGYQQRRAMLRAADAAYCVKHGDLVTYCGCRHSA